MFEKVRDIIAQEMGLDKEKITLESRLTEDLGADSLDAVQIIMALEDEYSITINDDDMMKIKKVSDIVEYLEKNGK